MLPLTSSRTRTLDRFARPLRDLRISVTDHCNFRCAYCLPPEAAQPVRIARSQMLSFEQITGIAVACADLGVHKIRLTGGEPLLRRGLAELVRRLARVDGIDDLALTTNGWLLADRAPELADAGLRRVTVSLDSLDDAVFARMTGTGAGLGAGIGAGIGAGVDRVVAGIRAARDAGLDPVKINTVVRRGVNESSVLPLARFARDEGLVLRLIEYMDVGQSHAWSRGDVVTGEDLVSRVGQVFPLRRIDPVPGAVATRYRYLDGAGEFGVISAVSRPFCDDCTRVRLTADGMLYTCLFAEVGHDLRPLLAADPSADQVRDRIAGIWHARTDRSSALRSQGRAGRGSVEMFRMGG